MVYYKRASEIPFPENDVLFVNKTVYNHRILYEMSISAYYTNDKDSGYKCIQKLLRRNDVPRDTRQQSYYNVRFYLKAFPNSEFTPISPQNKIESYNPCNPSLVVRNSQLAVICRRVNYTQTSGRKYRSAMGENNYDTQNTLMIYETTPQIKCIMESPIVNSIKSPFVDSCKVRGIEDARVVDIGGGKLAFSCTSLELTSDNLPKIAWVQFDENKSECQVESISRITGFEDHKIQKNWLPFVVNGETFFVYGYSPFRVLKFNPNTSSVKMHHEFIIPLHTEDWRGSSGPIFVPGYGQLILVHEVCDRKEGRRYMHRFVLFNETLTSFKAASDLFFFKYSDGVEMATGMAILRDEIYITLGIEDREAWLLKTSVLNVMRYMDQSQQNA
jgi:hypothetical protein